MRYRLVLAVGISLFTTLLSGRSAAEVTVSINNEGSFTEHAVTVYPGGSFLVDINVDTNEEIFDVLDVRFVASASHVLALVGGFYQAPWMGIGPIRLGELNPGSRGFGVTLPFPDYFGPGTSTLATLEMSVNAAAPEDVYTFRVPWGEHTVCRECPATEPISTGPNFMVEVVPEPTSLLLLLAGATLCLRRR